jgi:hypothetical protein
MKKQYSILACLICFLQSNFVTSQVVDKHHLEFNKKDNNYVSSIINIKKIDHNPFISMSLAFKSDEMSNNIKAVYYLDHLNNWKPFKKDIHISTNNFLVGHVDLDKHQSSTKIKIEIDKTLHLSNSEIIFYYPMDSDYLQQDTTEFNQTNDHSRSVESCYCQKPTTVTRSQWCPNGNCPPNSSPQATDVKFLVVHHTATPNNEADWAARVRQIWSYHVNTNGWSDIGYNFVIDGNGVVYDAREDDTRGAHFSGHNSETSGIALLGTFSSVSPTINSVDALKELTAWKACDKTIDVLATQYHNSSGLNLHTIVGHRDSGSGTVCPGDLLYNQLGTIRSDVSNFACYVGYGIPNNDTCNTAINLSSNLNCITTNGTVNGATSSGLSIPSCDVFANPLAADVFYKFVATQTEHTITVNPSNDLDTVLSLYEGSCNNLNEIECEDTAGGGGETTIINATDLTIGADYWIRVYHYGSQSPTNGDFDICITHSFVEDITVSNATNTPSSVSAGNNMTVSATQNYIGNQLNNDLPCFNLYYYLSTDCTLSANDILLGSDCSEIGSDHTSQNESKIVNIPISSNSGIYYIIYSADHDNKLVETNENNNTACIQLMVNLTLDIQENESFKNSLSLYPNPTTGLITLKTENYVISNMTVYDINSKQLLTSQNINNKIDISKLSAGIYFIKLTDSNNKNAVFRIIKK